MAAYKLLITGLGIVATALIMIGYMLTPIIFSSDTLKQNAGFQAQSTLTLTGIDNTPCILYLISYYED